MNDTPRTDKEACIVEDGCEAVEANFARKLERELNHIQSRLQTAWDEAAGMHPSMTDEMRDRHLEHPTPKKENDL